MSRHVCVFLCFLGLVVEPSVCLEDIFATVGDRIILPCKTSPDDVKLVQCEWTSDVNGQSAIVAASGSYIHPPPNSRTRLDSNLDAGHCNLVISSVQFSDAALYTCSLLSSITPKEKIAGREFTLIVQNREMPRGIPVNEESIEKVDATNKTLDKSKGRYKNAKAFAGGVGEGIGSSLVEEATKKKDSGASMIQASLLMFMVQIVLVAVFFTF